MFRVNCLFTDPGSTASQTGASGSMAFCHPIGAPSWEWAESQALSSGLRSIPRGGRHSLTAGIGSLVLPPPRPASSPVLNGAGGLCVCVCVCVCGCEGVSAGVTLLPWGHWQSGWAGLTTWFHVSAPLHSLSALSFPLSLFSCLVVSDSLLPHGLPYARLSILHCLPESAQTLVRWVGDALSPSHLLPSC